MYSKFSLSALFFHLSIIRTSFELDLFVKNAKPEHSVEIQICTWPPIPINVSGIRYNISYISHDKEEKHNEEYIDITVSGLS